MALFTYKRDAVRIKALKYDGSCMPESRKFSVDPQITSFDVLRNILAKAFDVSGEFALYYRVLDDYDQETYLPLLSDWDLDAAFVSAADPCLCLRVDIKTREQVIPEEWQATASASLSWITDRNISNKLQGLFMNHVEKTMNIVRGAFNLTEEGQQAQEVSKDPPRSPLTDAEFRQCLDPIGQLVQANRLRRAIYYGGVEPSLRRVVWKHILNVYPEGMSGKERMEYIKKKSNEYLELRDTWKNSCCNESMMDEMVYVTTMVKKDVLRTDRLHKYYAGNDDNQNIISLFNILTTYALNHPSVSYCQGMSDLASPLLVTMRDEAHAYICFCSLMRRLHCNFLLDGIMMTKRFQHLTDGLLHYDPKFFAYLKSHQADDLLFCYRWLLLEMKREFDFEDALRMLEVMWSSLPPCQAPHDLPLYEIKFCSHNYLPPPPSPSPRETPYTKICALRRQAAFSLRFKLNRSLDESTIAKRRLNSKLQSKTKKHNSLDECSLQKNLSAAISSGSSRSSSSYSSFNGLNSSTGSSSLHSSSSCDRFNSMDQSSLLFKPSLEKIDSRRESVESNHLSKKESPTVGSPHSGNKVIKNLNEFFSLDKGHKLKKKWDSNKQVEKNDKGNVESIKNNDIEDSEDGVLVGDISDDSNSRDNSPGDISEYFPMDTSMTRHLAKELEILEKQVFSNGNNKPNVNQNEVFLWENPLKDELKNYADEDNCSYWVKEKTEKQLKYKGEKGSTVLPAPREFGGGNPFLMFLCITVLCQHREIIINEKMDYNEIAMHFDKMLRKHNVTRVLNQARIMFAGYLKEHDYDYL